MNYVRVATAIPKVKVADVNYNVDRILELIKKARKEDVSFVIFPELSVTGYTCGDLFLTSSLREASYKGIMKIVDEMPTGITAIVGAPTVRDGKLFNSALILKKGEIIGEENKIFLPNYKEFYEQRWFSSGNPESKKTYDIDGVTFCIEICEDVWAPEPPSTMLVERSGAEIVFNLSASNELIGKHKYLVSLLEQQSARLISGYVYCSAGYGESSTDLVYAGNGIILENGKILSKSERFSINEQLIISDIDLEIIRGERIINKTFQNFLKVEKLKDTERPVNRFPKDRLLRPINPYPFKGTEETYQEIFNIQTHALAKRLEHTGMKAVIGVSGGSDSTWALVVSVGAMDKLGRDRRDIIGVSMPGFATSERTRENAKRLAEFFGITFKEIPIIEICKAELEALDHPLDVQDITYENVQARTRTQILMNISNQEGGLVIGTGDLSELALGWCTYNADHMSMYGINVSVPKTLIKELIGWYSGDEVFKDILETPISPELTGTGATGDKPQVTEDNIGPYEVHDFILYNFLRYGFSPEKILYLARQTELKKYDLKKWINVFFKRFFQQQFKRSCLPDGPKIGSISLSPRGDWRMPSDSDWKLWQLD